MEGVFQMEGMSQLERRLTMNYSIGISYGGFGSKIVAPETGPLNSSMLN